MNFLEKVDKLMAERGLNKNKLSQESGIPYMTITDWYKKGFENTRVSTAKKLANYFGVTLDYLLLDEIVDTTHKTTAIPTKQKNTSSPFMDEAKNQLCANYDKLNKEGRAKLVEYSGDLASLDKYKPLEVEEVAM